MMIKSFATWVGIAPEGIPLILTVALLGMVLWLIGLWWLGVPILLIAVAVASFFRDPNRNAPQGDTVISAADGRICGITEGPLPSGDGPAYRRISVFMSPLDVHVNRAPVSGRVMRIEHTAGDFRAAYRDESSEHNERNVIEFEDARGRRFAIVQIAGYLARRIVCRVAASDEVVQGQRVGLIMFGSRVDHFVPPDFGIEVKVGDRVRAGESILATAVRTGQADGS